MEYIPMEYIPMEDIKAKVKELGGWFEKDIIRFPSVYAKEQFEKWADEYYKEHPKPE